MKPKLPVAATNAVAAKIVNQKLLATERVAITNNLKFFSFASGSSGNAYFIGNSFQGILIDAGVSPRALRRGMEGYGLSFCSLLGVSITHDHIDHILYAGAYGEKLGLPVFATERVHTGIVNHPRVKIKTGACKRIIDKERPFYLGPFTLTAFDVPHDGSDNVGYCVQYEDKTFVIATDLGHITNDVAHWISNANYLILEANYDRFMLDNGPYPLFLKERISQKRGHLCNNDTADFLASAYIPKVSHLFLCHLSKTNNRPELALEAATKALKPRGLNIQIYCLPRDRPSACYEL